MFKAFVSLLSGHTCLVGSGLCDELVIRGKESYRVCVCVCVCVRARARACVRVSKFV